MAGLGGQGHVERDEVCLGEQAGEVNPLGASRAERVDLAGGAGSAADRDPPDGGGPPEDSGPAAARRRRA